MFSSHPSPAPPVPVSAVVAAAPVHGVAGDVARRATVLVRVAAAAVLGRGHARSALAVRVLGQLRPLWVLNNNIVK